VVQFAGIKPEWQRARPAQGGGDAHLPLAVLGASCGILTVWAPPRCPRARAEALSGLRCEGSAAFAGSSDVPRANWQNQRPSAKVAFRGPEGQHRGVPPPCQCEDEFGNLPNAVTARRALNVEE